MCSVFPHCQATGPNPWKLPQFSGEPAQSPQIKPAGSLKQQQAHRDGVRSTSSVPEWPAWLSRTVTWGRGRACLIAAATDDDDRHCQAVRACLCGIDNIRSLPYITLESCVGMCMGGWTSAYLVTLGTRQVCTPVPAWTCPKSRGHDIRGFPRVWVYVWVWLMLWPL